MGSSKMICPGCGVEMNQHAEKLLYEAGAGAAQVDPYLGGIVEQTDVPVVERGHPGRKLPTKHGL